MNVYVQFHQSEEEWVGTLVDVGDLEVHSNTINKAIAIAKAHFLERGVDVERWGYKYVSIDGEVLV